MSKLNDEAYFNDPPKPGLGGLSPSKYGAMSKEYWDKTHAPIQKDDVDAAQDAGTHPVVMVLSLAGLKGDDMGSFSGNASSADIKKVHDGLKEQGFTPLATPGAGQTVYHHPQVGVVHVTEETGLPKDDPRKFSVKNLTKA
jgi:hypothetical protein